MSRGGRIGGTATDALLVAFEKHLSELALSRTTIINYLADVRAFASWYAVFGSEQASAGDSQSAGAKRSTGVASSLASVTAHHIRAYRQHMRSVEKRTVSTVNRRLQALRKLYRFAQQAGWTPDNPAAEVALLPEPKFPPPRTLSQQEMTRLLEAARRSRKSLAKRNLAMLHLLLDTGLHIGELAALRLENLELGGERGYLTVQRGDGAAPRRLPLSAAACEALREYLATQPSNPDNPYLFLTQRGAPVSARTVQRVVTICARLAGLEDVSAYNLRQTRAALWLAETGDVAEGARRLGHRRLETTARYQVWEPEGDRLTKPSPEG